MGRDLDLSGEWPSRPAEPAQPRGGASKYTTPRAPQINRNHRGSKGTSTGCDARHGPREARHGHREAPSSHRTAPCVVLTAPCVIRAAHRVVRGAGRGAHPIDFSLFLNLFGALAPPPIVRGPALVLALVATARIATSPWRLPTRRLRTRGGPAVDLHGEAVAHFEKGLTLYDAGAWAPALAEAAREARRLYPLRNAGYLAALCQEKLPRYDEALDQVEGVLREFGEAMPRAAREKVQRKVLDMRALVGTLEIDGAEPGATVSVEGRIRGEYPLPATLRVVAGSHVVRVSKPGFEPFEARVEVAGAAGSARSGGAALPARARGASPDQGGGRPAARRRDRRQRRGQGPVGRPARARGARGRAARQRGDLGDAARARGGRGGPDGAADPAGRRGARRGAARRRPVPIDTRAWRSTG